MTTVVDDTDEIMKEIGDSIDNAIRRGVEEGIVAFALHAPLWTGLYQANLVAIAGDGPAAPRVDPRLRDQKNRGQFTAEISDAQADILTFISGPLPDVFTIDNPTPYAGEIEAGEFGTVTGDPPVMEKVARAISDRIGKGDGE